MKQACSSLIRMKKSIILFLVVLFSLSVYPQQPGKVTLEWGSKKEQVKLNEVKLNLATTIFGSYPEISYERILDSDISVGASAGVGLGDDYFLNFALIPYFRWFFGGSHETLQKYGAGFYLEANGAIFSYEYNDYDYYGGAFYSDTAVETGVGLGLAIGWKYLTKNNWVGDFYLGAGRDFANDGAYPRFGISIGKRF